MPLITPLALPELLHHHQLLLLPSIDRKQKQIWLKALLNLIMRRSLKEVSPVAAHHSTAALYVSPPQQDSQGHARLPPMVGQLHMERQERIRTENFLIDQRSYLLLLLVNRFPIGSHRELAADHHDVRYW